MYLQITTRCNMKCDHCGFDCTESGDDMSLETFREALKYEDESITIGGGEPTIHPEFWAMIGEALGSVDYVWLATNGKQRETALALARLAKRGVLGCDLSTDCYHEDIDEDVYEAFERPKRRDFENRDNDMRGMRDTSANLINAGRCDFGEDGCICPEIFVRPDGTVKLCGCEDSPIIGNVRDGWDVPADYDYGECHKSQIVCEEVDR